MKQIKIWFNNARSISLPQSVLPALTAIALSISQDSFSYLNAVIALLGCIFAHLGMNLADDYFDYNNKGSECRQTLAKEGMRSRIAKHPYLMDGSTSIKGLVVAICIFLLIAGICGAFISYIHGLPIIIIALIGLFLGISYSGFPFRLSYYGFGELVIGLMFGPLIMIGCYYSACGVFSHEIIYVSIPVGLLVTNIVYSHSIMDALPDEKANKMTFARLLHTNFAMLTFSAILNFLPFVIILIAVVFNKLSWAYCITFILLPMAIYLFCSLKKFVQNEDISLNPKFWMGPMSQWEDIKEAGIEWFMIRWLVARNLISFFCLIIIIINIAFRVAN